MNYSTLTQNPAYKAAVKELQLAEAEERQAKQKAYLAWKKVNEMEVEFKKRAHMTNELNLLINELR